jgi:hypothetical protein
MVSWRWVEEGEEMKWKRMFSGQEECWRMEKIAAIVPRR